MIPLTLEPLSEDALLIRFGDRVEPATNAVVLAAARALRNAALAGITDIAPAYASILVRFDPGSWRPRAGAPAHAQIAAALRATLAARGTVPATHPGAVERQRGAPGADHCIDIPVCYGGASGPDLEAVAARAGIGVDEVVARHTAPMYTVAMLGFAPGFPYLLGLDPVLRAPRRSNPRIRVPAGSVAIGGAQTGIYPRALPGGWQLIGCTPAQLFDPRRDPPALLAAGDRVRFRALDAAAFARMLAGSGGNRTPAAARDPD